MPRLNDLTGKRFGRLLVVRRCAARNQLLTWVCRCDCGVEKEILGQSLRRGETRSCGCLQRELLGKQTTALMTTHGETNRNSPEYRSWSAMISRCENPNATGYHNYGGRGIKVCERWRHSYETFLADMGRRPTREHTLDRYPDNDGNYEPGNCRWATKKQQRQNQRKQSNARSNNQ